MRFSWGSNSGSRRRAGESPGVASRVGTSFFFSIFLAVGVVFLTFIGLGTWQAAETYFWKAVPATILSSEVTEDLAEDAPFAVAVRYSYDWEGREITSDRYARSEEREGDFATARDRVAAIPAGRVTTAYVNPAAPEEAVLRRSDLWIGLFAVIPLVFVGVGAVGIYSQWNPAVAGGAMSESRVVPRSEHVAKGRRAGLLGGGIFFAVGFTLLATFIGPKVLGGWASRAWVEVPCEVISSRVKSHRGSESTTYSVDVFYRYAWEGREYQSNRFDVFGGSSSGYAAKKDIVAGYRPGEEAVCFVNPEAPAEAVLRRGVGWSGWVFVAIPLIFTVVGAAVFVGSWRAGRSGGNARAARVIHGQTSMTEGPVVLKASNGRWVRLALTLGIALFWNGIVSVFVWHAVEDFQRGRPDWFLTIFLVPFVAVGSLLVSAVVSGVAGLANPRCRLTLDRARPRVGGRLGIRWEMRGAVHRLERLVIILEGAEEATYTRGTTTSTDRRVFARLPLVERTARLEMHEGSGEVLLPADAMPTFATEHNKIEWKIRVWGKIPWWPDLNEEYGVEVARAEERR